MREDTTRNTQPLDRAWTIRTDGIRVPAPRLELGTGHDNVANLRCIISAALEEIERGQTRHAKSILITLKEVLS
jgi:glycine/serine hydroxymethyltransferase